MRKMANDPTNMDTLMEFLLEVLKPTPTMEEVDEFYDDDIEKIMIEYHSMKRMDQSEIKKKLSI